MTEPKPSSETSYFNYSKIMRNIPYRCQFGGRQGLHLLTGFCLMEALWENKSIFTLSRAPDKQKLPCLPRSYAVYQDILTITAARPVVWLITPSYIYSIHLVNWKFVFTLHCRIWRYTHLHPPPPKLVQPFMLCGQLRAKFGLRVGKTNFST